MPLDLFLLLLFLAFYLPFPLIEFHDDDEPSAVRALDVSW